MGRWPALRKKLLSLWDKAVGMPNYVKDEWIRLEDEVRRAAEAADVLDRLDEDDVTPRPPAV